MLATGSLQFRCSTVEEVRRARRAMVAVGLMAEHGAIEGARLAPAVGVSVPSVSAVRLQGDADKSTPSRRLLRPLARPMALARPAAVVEELYSHTMIVASIGGALYLVDLDASPEVVVQFRVTRASPSSMAARAALAVVTQAFDAPAPHFADLTEAVQAARDAGATPHDIVSAVGGRHRWQRIINESRGR